MDECNPITRDYTNITVVSDNQRTGSYFSRSRPHQGKQTVFFNVTKQPVYVRYNNGQIEKIPTRQSDLYPGERGSVYIEVLSGTFRGSVTFRSERTRYQVDSKTLANGAVAYIGEIDVHLSTNKNALAAIEYSAAEKKANSQLKQIANRIDNIKQCPIGVMLNDPTGSLKNVYMIVNDSVYEIPVHKESQYGPVNFVRFCGTSQSIKEAIVDFSISDMLEEFDKSGEFLVELDNYSCRLYPSFETAEEALSRQRAEIVKHISGASARETERLKLEYSTKIAELEATIKRLSRDNEDLREHIKSLSTISQVEESRRKREHDLAIQRMNIKKEEARVSKSELDIKSANIGVASSAVKSAAVIVPIAAAGACGAFALASKLSAPAAVVAGATATAAIPSLGIASIFAAATAAIVGVFRDKGLLSMASDTCSTISSGISNVVDTVVETGGKIVDTIVGGCESAISFAGDVISSVASGVGGFVGSAVSEIASWFG